MANAPLHGMSDFAVVCDDTFNQMTVVDQKSQMVSPEEYVIAIAKLRAAVTDSEDAAIIKALIAIAEPLLEQAKAVRYVPLQPYSTGGGV